VGSLQNLESAEAAGDRYPTAPCLAVNGIGSIVASLFGSCFPTTIYIGHPGWKEMGARVGYSWLNGVFMAILCLSGTIGVLSFFIPIDSGMAIVLWIGIAIVIQSVTATPKHHIPAVVVGLMPGIAGWAAGVAQNGMIAAGMGNPERPFSESSEEIVSAFQGNDVYIDGAFALEQGLVFSSMILATMVVYIVEREFGKAAIWSLIAAALAWVGLIHSYQWTIADTVIELGWGAGAQWATAYLLVTIVLLYAKWQTPQSSKPKTSEALETQQPQMTQSDSNLEEPW
jgi:AGZA family xanthine/uracil permease-like MFS transporter